MQDQQLIEVLLELLLVLLQRIHLELANDSFKEKGLVVCISTSSVL
jgi:hypothetical protein